MIVKSKLFKNFWFLEWFLERFLELWQKLVWVKGLSLTSHTCEVGYHFFLKYHNYRRDFKFYVLKNNIIDKKDRLSIETDLMHIFETLNPPLINAKIPAMYKINKLAFL